MLKKWMKIPSLGILFILLALQILSCGPSGGKPVSLDGENVQLIKGITQAESDEQRIDAINEVVEQGLSLGLLDADGNQLNPNVPDDAVSLTPEDIASFAAFVEIGHYTTIGDVVAYLAETGVVLSSTGKVITLDGFLPDLQDYINWSFNNSHDPNSQLGILLASGPDLQIPAVAPVIEPSTKISQMAAVMMLGDILIGMENTAATTWHWFGTPVYASDVQETAKRIQGLITQINYLAKPTNITISFLRKAGEITGLIEKSDKPTPQIKIPEAAKKIIGAFALGSHFAVRLYAIDSSAGSLQTKDMQYIKSFQLDRVGDSQVIIPALVLVSADKSAPVTVLEDTIPIMYSVRLLSPFETGVGTDLYPDANAIIATPEVLAATAGGAHILDIASNNEPLGGIFTVEVTKLENKENRIALLHASASILTGDLGKQFEKFQKDYGSTITSLGLKPKDLSEMFSVMQTAVKVSPWIAEVVLVGGKQVNIEPDKLTGKPNTGYTFTAKIDNQPAGSVWIWEAYLEQKGQNPKHIDTSMNKKDVALISFPEPGEYWVTATLMESDFSDAKVINSATSRVTINPEASDTPDIELSIETNQQPPYEGGCGMLFTAQPNVENEQLPENIRWEWYWGDGGEDVRKGQPHANRLEHMISHTYEIHGSFTVLVKLFNDNNNTLLATADRQLQIDNLQAIQRTTWVRAMLHCGWLEEISRYQNGQWVVVSSNRETFSWIGQSNRPQKGLKWEGNSFSVTWGDGTTEYKHTISGTVSDDASSVETITAQEEYFDESKNWTVKRVLTLTDVPITKHNCGNEVRYTYYLSGPGFIDFIKSYVTHYEYESRNPEQISKFTNFAWESQLDKPKLELEFSAME